MASMIDIKRRRESVKNTGQITKAMKLVSTVKLQRARTRAEESKIYFDKMYQTVTSILEQSGEINHPYLKAGTSSKKAVIAVSSNRGLAGGYNNNIVKIIQNSGLAREDVEIYGVGHKAMETLAHRGYHIKEDDSEMIDEPAYADALTLGQKVLEAFEKEEIGEIYLAYTFFKNTVVHEPRMIKLLPVEIASETAEKEQEIDNKTLMNYEPNPEEALSIVIPKYICSLIYGAFVTSAASENGARMQAMDSATNNAEDMMAALELAYNRARQGAITQELTEIISGAEALNT